MKYTKEQWIIFKNLIIFIPVTGFLCLLSYGAAVGSTGHWVAAVLIGIPATWCVIFCCVGVFALYKIGEG